MTKNQKIWFAVFLAMFLAPLILRVFGVRNSVDIPWLPFVDFGHFLNVLFSCSMVLFPLVGLLGIFLIIKKISINKKLKISFFIILFPLICLFVFLNVMFFWVMLYYMIVSPQIG
ncbi:MAG: hypothetical protein L7H18_03255 [Candidatus Nealsonbacteria bacterium DGGOD1a]|jgi:hypothetical protein|nr:MAG: hypothetical protein L7H18_03255 [Candidatus Nealsonbacteria bacterium DGGOD1a]